MKPLRAIGEEDELASLGSREHVARDQYRAPKIAMGIFLLVCCVGSYQLLSDYWGGQDVGATAPIRDVSDSFLRPSNTSDSGQNSASLLDPETILNTPTKLFDETIVAPQQLDNLANVCEEPYNPITNKLYLWHIPRSGATAIKRIAANCMRLTLASELGKTEIDVRGPENTLKILEGSDGQHFANVDMSFPDGIAHANGLHVGTDPRIDLVSSAYLYQAASIFDAQHKGYMFAMLRHPIDRAVSLFYNMRRYPQYARIIGPIETVEMYARSSLVENNWMTRFLSNTLAGQLGPQHEAMAKEVLRTKCIIGLLKDKTESMRRLEMFFVAKSERTQRREECIGTNFSPTFDQFVLPEILFTLCNIFDQRNCCIGIGRVKIDTIKLRKGRRLGNGSTIKIRLTYGFINMQSSYSPPKANFLMIKLDSHSTSSLVSWFLQPLVFVSTIKCLTFYVHSNTYHKMIMWHLCPYLVMCTMRDCVAGGNSVFNLPVSDRVILHGDRLTNDIALKHYCPCRVMKRKLLP